MYFLDRLLEIALLNYILNFPVSIENYCVSIKKYFFYLSFITLI